MKTNLPLYFKLKEDLIDDIKNSKLKPDEMITSENELCKQYNMSRPTVRQALGELTNMGYLYKIKGKGTFVSDINSIEIFDHSNGFLFSILDTNNAANRDILNVKTLNSKDKILGKHVIDYFDLEYSPNTDNKFITVEYTIFQNKKKILCLSILPARYFPDLIEKIKNNASSIDIIGGKYPLDPMHCKSVAYLSNADEHIAEILMLPKDSSILVVENELLARSGNIVEHNISYYSGLNSRIYFIKGRKR
ncbi:MAG: GntR family transcriptional regulator [Clostridia bacterium]|nr:GntR family transcriptional regulator [Clostridia bacterium]